MSNFSNESEKVLNKAYARINMPKKLYVGDPLYFEEYENYPSELKRLTYANNFKRPDWVGSITLTETEHRCTYKGQELSYTSIGFFACFAPNEEFLETYEQNQCYKHQKNKQTEIGVDTARYILGVDNRDEVIRTGADGFWGSVCELKNGNKLEGLCVDLGLGDLHSFKEAKQLISYLFNAEF